MSDINKFNRATATTQEEKLSIELTEDLISLTQGFIKLNKELIDHKVLFASLIYGSIGYTGRFMKILASQLDNKENISEFVIEIKSLMDLYIKDIENELL